tara:strand:+ start:102 stop:290 length:189 start_codon:yes stop_codon:yes gene_type:complete
MIGLIGVIGMIGAAIGLAGGHDRRGKIREERERGKHACGMCPQSCKQGGKELQGKPLATINQ